MQENKEERIMKQIKLEINIEACHYNELTEKDRKLIDAACEATKRSYAPYSHFAVGAAAGAQQHGHGAGHGSESKSFLLHMISPIH